LITPVIKYEQRLRVARITGEMLAGSARRHGLLGETICLGMEKPSMKLSVSKIKEVYPEETWKFLAMGGSFLIYALIVLTFKTSSYFYILALLPIVIGAFLEGIRGGVLMALAATLFIAISITLREGYPWTAHHSRNVMLVFIASWATAIGLGWLSNREQQRREVWNRLYAEAEEERRKLSAILAATTDAVIAIDDEGDVILINLAAERTFNLRAERLLGIPLSTTMSGEPLLGLFMQAVHCDQAIQREVRTQKGRTLNASVSPVRGVGWVAVMQDVTHLKEMGRMKDEMLATVSHDLKNPITSIQGFVDLISMAGSLNEQQTAFIKKVKKATSDMGALINDLLDIAWIESGMQMNKVPCAIPALVEPLVQKFQEQATDKKLSLQMESLDELPTVHGDPERLHQMLANLISNAIKYTPEGGRVTVRGGTRDGKLVLEVVDTGVGIAPGDLPKIFDRFFRAEDEFTQTVEGTGLGLSIVKSIVERHNGEIFVESQLGVGSTFRVILPSSC
jgi:PAS domain S-box-containing protein